MSKELVWVVLPRWMVLAPVLMVLLSTVCIVHTFRSGRPSAYRGLIRWFTLVCCGVSIISCFFIARHISQGRPVQTSSEKLISWSTVVPPPNASSATPDSKQ